MRRKRRLFSVFTGLLLLGSLAEAGRVRIVVSLLGIHSGNTEDVTGADEVYAMSFLSAGTRETAQAMLAPPISMNDDQERQWPYPNVLYDGVVDDNQPLIGGLRIYDEDFAKDWSQRPKWVDQMTEKGGQALQGSGNPSAAAAGVALEYGFKLFSYVAGQDADDLLGTYTFDISPRGPARQTIDFKFWRDDSTGYSSWNYNTIIQIQRLPVQEPAPAPPAAPPPRTNAPNTITAVWVKTSGREIRGLNGQELAFFYTQHNDSTSAGLGLKYLQMYPTDGNVRVNAMWEAGQPVQKSTFGKTYADYRRMYDGLWPAGWRLRLLDAYPAANHRSLLYNAVWEQTGGAEVQLYEATAEQVAAQNSRMEAGGMQFGLLQAIPTPQGLRYNAVWKPRTQEQTWAMGSTYEDYRKAYDRLWNQGFRLRHLQAYRSPDGVRYDAIWEKSGRAEVQLYGATPAEFMRRNSELSKQGWQRIILNTY